MDGFLMKTEVNGIDQLIEFFKQICYIASTYCVFSKFMSVLAVK